MILVLMMITGVIVGFLFTTFYFEYNNSEVKTAALHGKIFLVVVAVLQQLCIVLLEAYRIWFLSVLVLVQAFLHF